MTSKTSKSVREAELQQELQKIQAGLKDLQKGFKDIQKRSKDLVKKIHLRSDEKELQKIRSKLSSN